VSKMIYFDNAATTFPKPDIVYENMDIFYRTNGVNVGRGQYDLASKASNLVQNTRDLICQLFNCSFDQRVVFTSTATEAINIVLQGMNWQGNENVYITHFEHNGVLRCLNMLKKRYDLNIHYIDLDPRSLEYDLDKIQIQFQENKPNVVIANHASNVCGLITPVEEISRMAKDYNAEVVIDCCQTAGLLDIDLKLIEADYLIFSGHKTLYGPFGIAGFIIKENSKLKPLIYGGTGIDSGNLELPSTIPDKFEVGSQNIYAISGLNTSIKWILDNGVENIQEKERNLTKSLIAVLQKFDTKIYLSKNIDNHIGVISCNFKGIPADRIGDLLNQHNIAVRTGLHCAPDAHRLLGTYPAGTVRFSLGYFNNISDIIALEEVLESLLLY